MRLLILLVLALHLSSHHTPAISAARSTEALFPGQSLATGDKLVSGNGKFALGFFQLAGAGSTTDSRWYLGIWFNKIPNFTPVWVAYREEPLTDPSSSELSFSDDGNLVLFDRATNSTIWSSQANATATTNATVLVLLDTGNLVLRRRSAAANASSSGALWQSFDHPTDTLLPDATIGLDRVTGRTRRLVSRKNMFDQSPGAYSMELGLAGVVRLLWNSSVPYWSSGDWDERYQYFSSVPGMTVRHLFEFTFVDDGREVSFAYHLRDEADTVYSFLDVSGQRKVLLWHESSQEWWTIYPHPELQCDVHATCGPFAVCTDGATSPCSCMRGFSVAAPDDWELGDRTAGCKRDIPLDCGGSGSSVAGLADRFYAVAAVSLPYDRRSVGGHVASAAECEQACLSTCSCSAYSFGSSGCNVWHGELFNVKHLQFAVADAAADDGEVLYLRLAAKEFQTRKKNRGMVIGVAIATGIAALSLVALILLLMAMARRNRRNFHTLNSLHGDSGLIAFRYRDLQRATRDFSDKIGAGGFGSVFKGSLDNSTTIAVKRLNGSYRVEKQFRAEVSSIGILQHTNLVRMAGFCCERGRRLLVYEHMPNLSLDVHLFRSDAAAAALSWSTRYRIAVGVARGLAYLHESCRDCVIHCDVKPQNILLDGSFGPKIADFGMAKLMARDLSRVLTTARGTVGYLAPEWIGGMAITPKVDVYAYGMVLLEIVSGRMNSQEECGGGGGGDDDDDVVYFPVLAARKLLEGDVMSLVDRRLRGDAVVEEVERACKVACWCIQDSEVDRPTMGKVVQILEGLVEVEMPPVPRLLTAIAGRSHSACT
ncbi:hypothetical protein SETIT_7G095600v2 [Setaria italica]|uniref:Receptor-like serine/threonine-protein kinase n=1 Tax=Setaria italica TaxID=4555 RepID=A0A368RU08_SETIT|nr:G-type lectin S-receptor-like serine/threonine-protein kinase At2g19130 [Setaria italica]RCV33608.1 hypothetical protein SETIT_7G095600v2 [Setaria italica]